MIVMRKHNKLIQWVFWIWIRAKHVEIFVVVRNPSSCQKKKSKIDKVTSHNNRRSKKQNSRSTKIDSFNKLLYIQSRETLMQPKPIALSLKHKNTVCWELFSKVVMTCCFYWFLSSGGIDGNEKADALARNIIANVVSWLQLGWSNNISFSNVSYWVE